MGGEVEDAAECPFIAVALDIGLKGDASLPGPASALAAGQLHFRGEGECGPRGSMCRR